MKKNNNTGSVLDLQGKLNNGAVGKPPEFFTDKQAEIWNKIKGDSPDGSFIKSDYFILTTLCMLYDQFKTDPVHFADANYKNLIACLDKCLMTPKSRREILE